MVRQQGDPIGVWKNWNIGSEPVPYALTETYEMGAAWLEECDLVEDWGCGRGWMRTLIPPHRYRGIDGSPSEFADEVVDLRTYRSSVPGIFMRHVLEHNYDWKDILDNAISSFTERMVLILFTPLAEETHEIAHSSMLRVPDLSFALDDLVDRFDGARWAMATMKTPSQYEAETIFLLGRDV